MSVCFFLFFKTGTSTGLLQIVQSALHVGPEQVLHTETGALIDFSSSDVAGSSMMRLDLGETFFFPQKYALGRLPLPKESSKNPGM